MQETSTTLPIPDARDWLKLNAWIGTMSFGSAGRVLLYQRAVVDDKRWLTAGEFQEVITVAQLLPGPNLVNIAAYIGFRLFGFWVAFAGVLLLALPGAIAIVALLAWVPLDGPLVSALFRGFSLANCLLFAIFVWRLMPGLKGHVATQALPLLKHRLRVAVMALVAFASLSGFRLVPVLIWGCVTALAIEFGVQE